MFDDDFGLPDDLAAMADNAAAALVAMGDEYAQDAAKDADQLLLCAENVRLARTDDAILAAMSDVFDIAHNFKGQGATFGYDLVTLLGDALCEISRPVNNPTIDDVPRVLKLSASLHTILHQRIIGNGGELGAKLCTECGVTA